MFKKSKTQTNLLSKLEKQKLSISGEQRLIDIAIEEIKNKKNEYQVKRDLISKLNKLALNENLSKEGIQLLIQLNKPNWNEDIAKSSTTWF